MASGEFTKAFLVHKAQQKVKHLNQLGPGKKKKLKGTPFYLPPLKKKYLSVSFGTHLVKGAHGILTPFEKMPL
jgi:hypothetical protein